MQTLGSLVDQLQIVNLKMWNQQEMLYKIRHMSYDEFKAYASTDEGVLEVYNAFKKACDLNVQRANIVDEIDQYLVDRLKSLQDGTLDLDKLTQKKHKTY